MPTSSRPGPSTFDPGVALRGAGVALCALAALGGVTVESVKAPHSQRERVRQAGPRRHCQQLHAWGEQGLLRDAPDRPRCNHPRMESFSTDHTDACTRYQVQRVGDLFVSTKYDGKVVARWITLRPKKQSVRYKNPCHRWAGKRARRSGIVAKPPRDRTPARSGRSLPALRKFCEVHRDPIPSRLRGFDAEHAVGIDIECANLRGERGGKRKRLILRTFSFPPSPVLGFRWARWKAWGARTRNRLS